MKFIFFKLIFHTLCLSGCLWQVSNITTQYLNYETITQLDIIQPVYISAPILTFCFYLDQFPKGKRSSKTHLIFNSVPDNNSIGKLTEIHHSSTHNPRGISYTTNYLNVTLSIKKFSVCYSIDIHEKYNRFKYEQIVQRNTNPRFYIFKMPKSFPFHKLSIITIYLSSRQDHFHGPTSAVLEVNRGIPRQGALASGNNIALTYSSYISKRLPPPYKTQCFDYRFLKFDSQKHCLQTCYLNNSLALKSPMPGFVMISADKIRHHNLSIVMSSQRTNLTLRRLHDQISATCDQKCSRSDCYEQELVAKLVKRDASYFPTLDFFVPDSPSIVSTYVPKLDFIQFTILGLSCIAFWLGFSPLTFILARQFFKSSSDHDNINATATTAECSKIIFHLKSHIDFIESRERIIFG